MKKLSKIIAMTLLAFATITSTGAFAAGKIGFVNTGKLLQDLPQMKSLQQKLEKQGKDKRASLDRMKKDIDAKISNLQRNAKTMKANEIDNLRIDIQSSQAKLEVKAKEFQTEMAQIERTEMQKINEKIQKAIDSVAQQGGYDIILNGPALAYAKSSADVTAAVIKQIR